jgi:hypothetical protein
VRTEKLALNPLLFDKNQHTSAVNFHQDFVAVMLSNFFKGEMDMAYFIGLNILGKLSCPMQKKRVCFEKPITNEFWLCMNLP